MAETAQRYYGIYRGVVYTSKDPLSKRRIRVTVPQLFDTEPTQWAWPREDASVKTQTPKVGQGVWVMFEGGDPAFPVWVGTFGKTAIADNHGLLKPSTASLTGLSPYLTSIKNSDGTTEIDILSSLVKLAQTCKSYETRIAQLEAQMPIALQNGL